MGSTARFRIGGVGRHRSVASAVGRRGSGEGRDGGKPMARKAGAQNRAGGQDRPRRWLVDGMNLIGSRPDRWWNDPDRAVRRLIEELDRYGRATGEDVTVVFDRRPRDVSPGSHGTVTVAFASRRGRNAADDEIAEMVGEDEAPHTLTVVTSDRGLIERVRARGADVASAPSFRRRLDAALKRRIKERSRP
jgi:predicted RNA-binding protein with PIN domain